MSQQVALMFMPATMGYLKDHAPSFFYYLFPTWVAEQCPIPSVDIQVNFLPLDPPLFLEECEWRTTRIAALFHSTSMNSKNMD